MHKESKLENLAILFKRRNKISVCILNIEKGILVRMESKLIENAIIHWKLKNKTEDIFIQCVQEFYKRAKVRYNWDDKILSRKLQKLEKLKNIKFEKMEGVVDGKLCYYIDFGYFDILIDKSILNDIIKNNDSSNFVYTVMHELVHFADYHEKEATTGLKRKNKDGTMGAIVINELATVINAELLSEGIVKTKNHNSYEYLNCAVKVFLAAVGIDEKKLADLQSRGRKNYESYFRTTLGKRGVRYVRAMEDILDTIDSIIHLYSNKRLNKDGEINLRLQLQALEDYAYMSLIEQIDKKKMGKSNMNSITEILNNSGIMYKNIREFYEMLGLRKNEKGTYQSQFISKLTELCQMHGMKWEEVAELMAVQREKCMKNKESEIQVFGFDNTRHTTTDI